MNLTIGIKSGSRKVNTVKDGKVIKEEKKFEAEERLVDLPTFCNNYESFKEVGWKVVEKKCSKKSLALLENFLKK